MSPTPFSKPPGTPRVPRVCSLLRTGNHTLLGLALIATLVAALAWDVSATSASPGAVDLGTLGGSFSTAVAVNANGQVVGSSTTAGDAETHAFSWTAAGGMVDLGTLGGTYSEATAVNASGQVVGVSLTAGDVGYHAFSWTVAGGMTDLGTLSGHTNSSAHAVNNSGQVVGDSWCLNCVNSGRSFFWTQSGGMVEIGGPTDTSAAAINASGEVVGFIDGANVFSWTAAGGIIDLPGPAGYSELNTPGPQSVNDSGQVVGQAETALGDSHAFLWTPGGGIVDLGTLGEGTYSDAAAVSASGQVVGVASFDADDSIYHAFSWTAGGGIVDLGTLPGDAVAAAFAVNAGGQVVGISWPQPGYVPHGFAWTASSGMIDLGTLGGAKSYAAAISDSGLVVGWSTTTDDAETHAVVWQLSSGNTPAGVNVAVSPSPGITLTFSTVSAAGNTTATASTSPPPPQGFSLDSVVYDISTTATTSGAITVCLPYSANANPATLSLLHYENGTWLDVTTSRDTSHGVICGQVTSLSPFAVVGPAPVLGSANIWVGLKNSDDVGIRFDLRAEVYRNGTQLVGQGEIAGVPGGSSGFNNAKPDTITLYSTGVSVASGDTLSLKLLVRNACTGSGKNSGTARLWYNDSAANSRFATTIPSAATNYLVNTFALSGAPGAGPKSTIDVAAGAKCSAYKAFGTWSRTLP